MIKNLWYAILNSKKVKDSEIVGVKRLNKELALFRDENSKIHCVEDICAHRGAKLSNGEIKNNCIKCPFHGIEYDKYGDCVFIPSEGKNSSLDYTRFNLKEYPVIEKNDIIYLWYGDKEADNKIESFEILEDDSFQYSEIQDLWKVHYSRVIENQLDVSHLPFVHHNTIGRGNKTLVNGPKFIWLDENTLLTGADNEVDFGQKPKISKNSKIKNTNLTFKFPNQWLNTVSDKLKIMAYFVPVDEESTLLCIRFYNKITGIKAIDKIIAWFGKYANIIIEKQDKRVVETQKPKKSELKMNENLLQADMAIIQYRKRREALKNK